MNLNLNPQDQLFREQVRDFFRREYPLDILTKIASGQRMTRDDHVISQQALQQKGWLASSWPKAFGGPGWSPVQQYVFDQELEKAGAPSLIPMGVIYVGPVIIEFGTTEQQKRWLGDILNSRSFWAQGYSEPEAGSDLTALTMRARSDGDEYIVDGIKTWTTMAHWADWIFCLVRTSDEDRKRDGISFLCIEMQSPGIDVLPIISMNGAHELNQVNFNGVRVPKSNRIGKEGSGWKYANFLLQNERLSYAHVGRKRADLKRVIALAETVPGNFTDRLIDEPLFASRWAQLSIEVNALEIFVLRALVGDLGPGAVSSLKIVCTQCAQKISKLLMDVGARAALPYPARDTADWSRELRQTPPWAVPLTDGYLFERAQTIYGGTSEIQKSIVWRAVNARCDSLNT